MDASYLTQQLLYQLPLLLVCTTGLILSLVFFRKSTGPSILTLIASGIVLLSSIAIALIQSYLVQARLEQGWSTAQYARLTSLVAIAGSIVRAGGFGLLLAAVFIGRKRAASAS
jgi:hypothetical protein